MSLDKYTAQLRIDIQMLMERLNKIERILSKYMLVPAMKEKILSFLHTHPNVPTRIFTNQVQPTSEYYGTLEKLAWLEAKAQLEADGQIISHIQGKRKNRTWTLKDDDQDAKV